MIRYPVNTVLKRGRRSRRASLFAVIAIGLVCHTTAHETQGPLNDDPRQPNIRGKGGFFLTEFPSRARGCTGSALVFPQMSREPINSLREMQNLCLTKLVNLLME